jgi:hypothetical protein
MTATATPEPLAVDLAPADVKPRTGSRLRDRLVAVLFMAMLVIPGFAFVGGLQPDNIERRPFAPFPGVSLDALADGSWFQSLGSFLNDNFPFRTAATEIKARIALQVFGATSAQVTPGLDGWLYLTADFNPPCKQSAASMLQVIDQASARLAARGTELTFTIVPDKRTAYPEHTVPGGPTPCTEVDRAQLRLGMAARPATTIDMWSVIEQAKASTQVPLYWRLDTHWTETGGVAGIRAIVNSFQPGVWDESAILRQGTVSNVGDLSRLAALPETNSAAQVVIRRDVETTSQKISDEGMGIYDIRTTGDVPLIQGETLFVVDSFLWDYRPMISQYFAHSTWLWEQDLVNFPDIARNLPRADHLFVEMVERGSRDGTLAEVSDRAQPD